MGAFLFLEWMGVLVVALNCNTICSFTLTPTELAPTECGIKHKR